MHLASDYIHPYRSAGGRSGLALYWNRLVWKNTFIPFRVTPSKAGTPLAPVYLHSCSLYGTAQKRPVPGG
jgi:hypothetical protein